MSPVVLHRRYFLFHHFLDCRRGLEFFDQDPRAFLPLDFDELLADYHKSVITAFGNVEDALNAVHQTADQRREQQKSVDKAQLAYDLAMAQFHAGTINILTVLSTETALFTARDTLAQVELAHLQAVLQLYNALGGGWLPAQEKSNG